MATPKQHHYVPESYLENFCASDGTLWVHDKWNRKSFRSRPKSILKENFYYAQPDHDNKTWSHAIEHFFSAEIETPWPKTVKLIQNGSKDVREFINLYMFMAALRVRIPNCRKAIEYTLQQQVRIVSANLKGSEFLELEKNIIREINRVLGKDFQTMDDLYEEGVIDIKIDPHQSIIAMGHVARGFSLVVSKLQLHFIKNCTSIDFYSSDNPIVYFPCGQEPGECTPYQFREDWPFEFIFPITKNHCLYHNSIKPIQAEQIVSTETKDTAFVERINDFIAAFADRYVVSSKPFAESYLPESNRCPRPVARKISSSQGTGLFIRYEMGKPLRLPKWTNDYGF